MNRHTGRKIEGQEHLIQSVQDILTTPKGSLVMMRDYGSNLPDIIDQPLNGETIVDAYMAVAEALDLWEPRLNVARVQLVENRAGYAVFELYDDEDRIIHFVIDQEEEANQ